MAFRFINEQAKYQSSRLNCIVTVYATTSTALDAFPSFLVLCDMSELDTLKWKMSTEKLEQM